MLMKHKKPVIYLIEQHKGRELIIWDLHRPLATRVKLLQSFIKQK